MSEDMTTDLGTYEGHDVETMSRFFTKVDATGPCWEWTAYVADDGYGRFRPSGRDMTVAHRVAWELLVGPVPDDLELDHLCRNRRCVNPDHLEPVTHAENVLRSGAITALEARQTHCKRGHRFTRDTTYITSRGGRQCKPCIYIRRAERRAERAAA